MMFYDAQGCSPYNHSDWTYTTPLILLLPTMSCQQQKASDLKLLQGLCMTVVVRGIEASPPPSCCFVLLRSIY